ncbi:hypothetical protein HEQ61_11045, partial [Haematospirillum sp. H4485]|nr:hypothetical protein [Haematospirillum sp. H4890]NKD76158.1 hypothetical protein [Haematospirillum sp. H4485]
DLGPGLARTVGVDGPIGELQALDRFGRGIEGFYCYAVVQCEEGSE